MNRMEIERDEQIREVEHWLKAQSVWEEKHGSKSKPKQSRPLKRPKTRKTAAAETEL